MPKAKTAKTVKKPRAKKEKKLSANPKGTLTLNDALLIVNEKISISKMGLRIAAVRDGFISHHKGFNREKVLLDEAKFKKWIKDTIDAIPKGFVLISTAARKLNITSSYTYTLVNAYKIKAKKIGSGRGKIYIDYPALEKVMHEKRNKDK